VSFFQARHKRRQLGLLLCVMAILFKQILDRLQLGAPFYPDCQFWFQQLDQP